MFLFLQKEHVLNSSPLPAYKSSYDRLLRTSPYNSLSFPKLGRVELKNLLQSLMPTTPNSKIPLDLLEIGWATVPDCRDWGIFQKVGFSVLRWGMVPTNQDMLVTRAGSHTCWRSLLEYKRRGLIGISARQARTDLGTPLVPLAFSTETVTRR